MIKNVNSLSLEEASERLSKIEESLINEKRKEKAEEKFKRKGLYWWFLLPFLGWFIFSILLSRRSNIEYYQLNLDVIKTNIIELELDKILLKKRLEKLNEQK